MEVSALLLVSVGVHSAQKLPQPLNPRDPQDVDAAVAAEGLQQREVDLQRHVLLVVGRQDAQDHAVRISGETEGKIREGGEKNNKHLVSRTFAAVRLGQCRCLESEQSKYSRATQ